MPDSFDEFTSFNTSHRFFSTPNLSKDKQVTAKKELGFSGETIKRACESKRHLGQMRWEILGSRLTNGGMSEVYTVEETHKVENGQLQIKKANYDWDGNWTGKARVAKVQPKARGLLREEYLFSKEVEHLHCKPL